MSGCTRREHDEIMRDPARVAAETTHVGWQSYGALWLELLNCRHCRSTLARKVTVEMKETGTR